LTSQCLLRRAAASEALSPAERAALARWISGQADRAALFGLSPANADAVVAERLRLLPAVARAIQAEPLRAAGYQERVACAPEELFLFHIPLAQFLVRRVAEAPGRCLVAIAGVPAGGKTVFAALMARVLKALDPPFGIATVGLDGYHYPNAYLDTHRAPRGVTTPGTLRLYKGAHFTFDAGRLAGDLARLRSAQGPVSLPAYDRTAHDPVDDAICVGPGDHLVLVEGNYLLLRRGKWRKIPELFDIRIYLDLPPGVNRGRMIARHIRGGRTPDDAAGHFERTDRANTALVAATRPEADLIVGLSATYQVVSVMPGLRTLPRA